MHAGPVRSWERLVPPPGGSPCLPAFRLSGKAFAGAWRVICGNLMQEICPVPETRPRFHLQDTRLQRASAPRSDSAAGPPRCEAE